MSAASDRATASMATLADNVNRLGTAYQTASAPSDTDSQFNALADTADGLSNQIDTILPKPVDTINGGNGADTLSGTTGGDPIAS